MLKSALHSRSEPATSVCAVYHKAVICCHISLCAGFSLAVWIMYAWIEVICTNIYTTFLF